MTERQEGRPATEGSEPDGLDGTDYWSRIRRRERHESGIPWGLGDKMSSKQFFAFHEFPHAATLKRFERVEDIDFDSLSPSFVLKPTFAHTSAGVFIIESRSDGYFDRFSGHTVDLDHVHRVMHQVYRQFEHQGSQRHFMAEAVVDDINDAAVPVDYKFFMFYDRVGICLAIDRNVTPIRYDYWSSDLRPLAPGAVYHLRPDEVARGSCEPPTFLGALRDFAITVSTSVPIPMCRVDLYMTTQGPLLGEITLLPGNFYYEDRTVMSAGLSAHLGVLWGQAEKKVKAAFGSYPICEGELRLEELLKMTTGRDSTDGS